MKKLFILALVLIATFTSCDNGNVNEDYQDCIVTANAITEQYNAIFAELIPEDVDTFDPNFDWEPFKQALDERNQKLEELNCDQYR